MTCPTHWYLRAENVYRQIFPQRFDNMEAVLQKKVEEMKHVEKELAEVKNDMVTVKSVGEETRKDVVDLKDDMSTVNSASEETRKDVAELKNDMSTVKKAGEEMGQDVLELVMSKLFSVSVHRRARSSSKRTPATAVALM